MKKSVKTKDATDRAKKYLRQAIRELKIDFWLLMARPATLPRFLAKIEYRAKQAADLKAWQTVGFLNYIYQNLRDGLNNVQEVWGQIVGSENAILEELDGRPRKLLAAKMNVSCLQLTLEELKARQEEQRAREQSVDKMTDRLNRIFNDLTPKQLTSDEREIVNIIASRSMSYAYCCKDATMDVYGAIEELKQFIGYADNGKAKRLLKKALRELTTKLTDFRQNIVFGSIVEAWNILYPCYPLTYTPK